jgi:predicted outer membrane protein
MKRNLIPVALFVLVLVATNLLAGGSGKAQGLSAEEQQFVKKAAAGGLAEVKLSELADDRASDPKVKDFAKQMVIDHTQANNELKPHCRGKQDSSAHQVARRTRGSVPAFRKAVGR